eukprot:274377_1
MATQTKNRITTSAKRTDTIRVLGLPSFQRNVIHVLTSNHWFGNIGKIAHVVLSNNDHVAEIRFSLQKEAQAALRWVHQYNASKPKPHRKLQANYTQNALKPKKPSPLSANIMLKEYQSLQRQLHTLSSNHTKLKQKNKLLHQIIKRLQANIRRNEHKQDALTAENQTLQNESQNIKNVQLELNEHMRKQQQTLETETAQMSEIVKSIQAENNRLKQIRNTLETDKNASTKQKLKLQNNYQLMQRQLNVMIHQRERMLSEKAHNFRKWQWYKEQYYVIMDLYESLKGQYLRVLNEHHVVVRPQWMTHMVSPSPPSLTQEPVEQTMKNKADAFDWLSVCHWIVGIQDGVLMKYVNELSTALRDGKIGFEDLYDMKENDLRGIGITEWKDVHLLFDEIQKLRLSNDHESTKISVMSNENKATIEGDMRMDIEGDPST